MYPNSSQKQFWTFSSEQKLNALRAQHNTDFIDKHGAEMNVRIKYLLTLENTNIIKVKLNFFRINKN